MSKLKKPDQKEHRNRKNGRTREEMSERRKQQNAARGKQVWDDLEKRWIR